MCTDALRFVNVPSKFVVLDRGALLPEPTEIERLEFHHNEKRGDSSTHSAKASPQPSPIPPASVV